jgi:hypothetical protein
MNDMLVRHRQRMRNKWMLKLARWGVVACLLATAWLARHESQYAERAGIASVATIDPTHGVVPLAAAAAVALRHWYESRGLPYEDGRSRRKKINETRGNAA